MLQVGGVAATFGLAGCAGLGGGGTEERNVQDPVQDRVTVDPADIQEGGTFRTALGTTDIDSFDSPYSNSAAASNIHGLLYEGMITTNAKGQLRPFLASSFEQVAVNDVSASDYVEYMTEVSYVEGERAPVLDTDLTVLVEDPENPDSPSPGDTAQVLTTEQAGAAIDDGTFGIQYDFELEQGVTFHNGEEMTATDVVASYERIRGSLLEGQVYDSLLDIQETGTYSVSLYTQIPDAAALRNLGGLDIFPESLATLPGGDLDPSAGNTPVGTGAFEFAEYEAEDFARFTTFDEYWLEPTEKDWFDGPEDFPSGPVVDEVDIRFISDPATQSAALNEGELDMAYGLNPSDLTSYDNDGDFRVSLSAGGGYTFMQFPVNVEPFDDPRMRRAINRLIPREQISNNIFQNWENPADVPCPPLTANTAAPDYQELSEELAARNELDVEEATSLAQEVIDERDLETPIQVTFETNTGNPARVRTMELITEQVNQLDIFEAELMTREFLAFVQDLTSGSYQDKGRLAFIGLSGGFGPHGYIKAVHSPENFAACCNFQNVDNEEINQQLENARFGTDVVEDTSLRRERYAELQRTVLEVNANSYGTHSTVVGVVPEGRVNGFNAYPISQSIIPYAVYDATDQQIVYLEDQG